MRRVGVASWFCGELDGRSSYVGYHLTALTELNNCSSALETL